MEQLPVETALIHLMAETYLLLFHLLGPLRTEIFKFRKADGKKSNTEKEIAETGLDVELPLIGTGCNQLISLQKLEKL